MLLETGIFVSQAIWLWRVRHIRREAKKAGKTYDEYIAENPSEKLPRSESSGIVVDVEACREPSIKASTADKVREESIKSAVVTDSANLQGKASLSENSLLQRWRRLVLRPAPGNWLRPDVIPWLWAGSLDSVCSSSTHDAKTLHSGPKVLFVGAKISFRGLLDLLNVVSVHKSPSPYISGWIYR